MDSRLLTKYQAKQGVHELFSSFFCIMNKLKEAEIERQLFLRNSYMGPQPRT